MALNEEPGKEITNWRHHVSETQLSQTETCNSGALFQLIPHSQAVLGLGPTLTPASPFLQQSHWCTVKLGTEWNFIFFKGQMPFWQGLDIGNTPLKRFRFQLTHTVTTGEQESHKEWQTGHTTPTTGSSESQPLPPGTGLGHTARPELYKKTCQTSLRSFSPKCYQLGYNINTTSFKIYSYCSSPQSKRYIKSP